MTLAAERPRAAFRGDIQGMRALAVLMVIAAHAGSPLLGGGFAGVDAFFVVSGFLITQLIVNEVASTERFSLTGFYGRRAKRILPAASVVLIAVVVLSVIYLSFIDAIEVAKDAIWAAAFGANIRFWTVGTDYFSQEKPPSPLQHYWSLSVEEQFYLVWPLIIALGLVLARRRQRRHGTEGGGVPVRGLFVAVTVLGTASLIWSIVHTANEPAAAYFSAFTRAWELAVGAGLALLVHARRVPRGRVGSALGWLGLAALLVTCLSFDDAYFPGYAALVPVLGTALVLWSGSNPERRTLLGRGLSVKPLTLIGDWSYSLYLWHWPLMIIPANRMGQSLSTGQMTLAVIGTFVLGAASFYLVERPVRRGRTWRLPSRSLALYPVCLVTVVAVAIGGWQWSNYRGGENGDNPAITVTDFPGVASEPTKALVQASVLAAEEGRSIPSDLTPDLLKLSEDIADVGECDYTDDDNREICRRGDPDADKTLVVTGDSHARAWIPAFEQIAEEAGYAAYYLVKPQCTAAFVDPARVVSGEPWPACTEFHEWVTEQVAELQPDLMVIATSPPPRGVYKDGELLEDIDDVRAELRVGFEDAFAAYADNADRLVLLADTPRISEDPGTCLAAPGADLGDCLFEPARRSALVRDVSVKSAEEAGLETIDPTPWLCYEEKCPVVIGSTIAYRDRGHISDTRAGELALPLGEALGLIEVSKPDTSAEPTDSPDATDDFTLGLGASDQAPVG